MHFQISVGKIYEQWETDTTPCLRWGHGGHEEVGAKQETPEYRLDRDSDAAVAWQHLLCSWTSSCGCCLEASADLLHELSESLRLRQMACDLMPRDCVLFD